MRPQMLSDAHARLNLPRPVSRPPRIPLPHPVEGTLMAPAGAGGSLTSRRDWIAGLTGGLGSLEDSQHARHHDPVLTLVHRITHGFSLDEYERALALGFEGYLEEQLDHLSIDDSALEAFVQLRFPIADMSPKEVYDAHSPVPIVPYSHLKNLFIARSVNSRRQLFERMCEFWGDHFNIDHNKGLGWALLPEHDRTVIRQHALGSFPELLQACAFSGAMLYYLDNWLNVRSAPQNNYARELLELHTLSVYGGYNLQDVDEVAKCFTGWTLNGDPSSPDWLRGKFDPALHLPGQKLVLGHMIPGAPPVGRPGQAVVRNDALQVLEIVSAHPSTASFLASKLIQRFLTPTPPQELVDRVAATYLATQGDIKAMLRVILTRANLSADSTVLGPKYKRPFGLLVSLLRGMRARINRSSNIGVSYLAAMGHMPFDYDAPTGYPDDFRSWGSSLLPRWDFTARFLRHDVIQPGVDVIEPADLQDWLEIHVPADRPGLARRMNERIFGQSLRQPEVAVLQAYIDDYPSTFEVSALYDSLVLASSLPGFQWY